MADLERIKRDIKKIAQHPASTRFREIERVVRQLGEVEGEVEYDVKIRPGHTNLFTVQDQRWGVCRHNKGRKHVKICYVREFLRAMANLDLYDEGEQ